jgi:hypothetical protein
MALMFDVPAGWRGVVMQDDPALIQCVQAAAGQPGGRHGQMRRHWMATVPGPCAALLLDHCSGAADYRHLGR